MNKYGIMPELLPAPACAISLPRGVPSWMAATWCDAGLALTQAHSRSFIGSSVLCGRAARHHAPPLLTHTPCRA